MRFLYLLGTVVFTVYGQLILKWRIGQYGQLPDSLGEKISFLFRLLLDPFVLSGFVSAFVASFFWMAAMTVFDVSYAYPFITAGLTMLTVVLAIAILGEPLTANKLMGISLIVAGVLVAGRGA